jgi:hypothetical protein
MTISLEEILQSFPEERRRRIEKRAAELIAEEMNLREVRRLRKLTQSRLSKRLKIGQEGVSRIERRSDMNVSTLRGYVEGMGGELTLMIRFPDQAPVVLAGLGGDKGRKMPKSKPSIGAKSKPKTRPAA